MLPHIISAFLLLITLVHADDYVGCYSKVSVAKSKGSFQWQTPSHCIEECSDYPYVAVKNGQYCYCLSKKPSSSSSTSDDDCQVTCFGYGTAKCGGTDAYGIYKGDGTDDSDDDSSSSSSSDSSSSSSSTASSDSSSSSSSSSKSSDSSSSASKSSSHSSITSGPTSSDSKQEPKTTRVVTTSSESSNGHYIYKTVTQTSSATGTLSDDDWKPADPSDDSSNKKSNVGPIVGGVVGGIGGAILLAALAFLFIRHRNKDNDDDEEEFYDKANETGLGRGGTAKSRRNMNKVASPLDMPMSNPFVHPNDDDEAIGAPGATGPSLTNVNHHPNSHSSNTTNSISDSRLNPMMMGRRRLSEGSLADETDYSRKILQVANPDT